MALLMSCSNRNTVYKCYDVNWFHSKLTVLLLLFFLLFKSKSVHLRIPRGDPA
jgi:hypothetical protein